MRSQIVIACLGALATACGSPTMSHVSPPDDAPDLDLNGVAFARLLEGRVVARGTFDSVGYLRPGGRLNALRGTATLEPEAGTAFASWGTVHVVAPAVT